MKVNKTSNINKNVLVQISLVKVNTTIDITVICIVYSILLKYTKLLNLSQNNILSASSQRSIIIFSRSQKSKVIFQFDHFDQGHRSEYSDY